MKKNIFYISLVISFVFLFASCNNNKTTIKGTLNNAVEHTLYLEELNVSVRKIVDSVKLKTGKNNFSFTYNFTKNEPAFLILRANTTTLATLLVDKGEKVVYNGDLKQPANYTIEGSDGSVLVKHLNDDLRATTVKFDSLKQEIVKAEAIDPNTEIMNRINMAMGSLMAKHKQSLIRFIVSNPKSFASFTAIYQKIDNQFELFGKNEDILYYKTLIDSLSPIYPQSPYVQILKADYEKIEKAIKLQYMLENAQETDLIDIELTNNKDEKVKLSSLNADVVLVDFWTTQDVNFLMNNRELQEVYNKFHTKGFEIYQICVDRTKDKWFDAIRNQGLSWISVIDTPDLQTARTYNIAKLPSNFLMLKSGEIVGRDLYGDDLEKKLNELLR